MLKTVILHHVTRTGSHYDWLMEDPSQHGNPDALLWTARMDQPPWLWRADQKQSLVPIAPHRRHYLTWQGPIGQGPLGEDRGSVKRVAQGRFFAPMWTPSRRLLHIQWDYAIASPASPTAALPSYTMRIEVNLSSHSSAFILPSKHEHDEIATIPT